MLRARMKLLSLIDTSDIGILTLRLKGLSRMIMLKILSTFEGRSIVLDNNKIHMVVYETISFLNELTPLDIKRLETTMLNEARLLRETFDEKFKALASGKIRTDTETSSEDEYYNGIYSGEYLSDFVLDHLVKKQIMK